jgi:hypothetical protein
MVADSDEKSRDLMCEALEKLGLTHLVCAATPVQAIEISSSLTEKEQCLSIVFWNENLQGMPIEDLIAWISRRHKGVIPVSYSKNIAPEAHVCSLLKNKVLDHVEQGDQFEVSLGIVVSRWTRAARLTFDHRSRYGLPRTVFG